MPPLPPVTSATLPLRSGISSAHQDIRKLLDSEWQETIHECETASTKRAHHRRRHVDGKPMIGARLRTAACTAPPRSEEHTSELQSLMRISYAVFCLKKKKQQ